VIAAQPVWSRRADAVTPVTPQVRPENRVTAVTASFFERLRRGMPSDLGM
jgi:hypothetical protein